MSKRDDKKISRINKKTFQYQQRHHKKKLHYPKKEKNSLCQGAEHSRPIKIDEISVALRDMKPRKGAGL